MGESKAILRSYRSKEQAGTLAVIGDVARAQTRDGADLCMVTNDALMISEISPSPVTT
jgi:hypothetical protein